MSSNTTSKMEVRFTDLTGPTCQIAKKYLEAVEKFLDKGNFILTDEVRNFEKDWARTIGADFCIGVSSGADALYLALRALNISRGNEVVIQGNAYNASVTAILRVGAVPRFVDIDAETLCIDVNKIEPLINKKTKAIMPVHLYGQMNDMKTIMAIAKKYNLAVIEDCAQAHLAKFDGRCAGVWGDIGAFSFYPTKNLGAFGDAGAIVTRRNDLYEKILALRNLGQVAKNEHQHLGFNMRLDPIQAIALSLKLKFLSEATQKRIKAARYYDRLLKEADISIKPQAGDSRAAHVYHLYVVQTFSCGRDKLREELSGRGIQTAIHYPVPVYRQHFFKGPKDPCPVTDDVSKKIVSLPMFTDIKKREQKYVIDSLKQAIK